jgi:hypothetical protein
VLIDTLLEVKLIPSSFFQHFPDGRARGCQAGANFGLKDGPNITKNILVFLPLSTTATTTVATR